MLPATRNINQKRTAAKSEPRHSNEVYALVMSLYGFVRVKNAKNTAAMEATTAITNERTAHIPRL